MIVDSHCHLDFTKFRESGLKNYDEQYHCMQAVLKRAKAEGITHILAIGTTLKDSADNINVSRETISINDSAVSRGTLFNDSPKILAAVGIHPDYAKSALNEMSLNDITDELFDMTTSPEVVCIGECGVDYRNGKNERAEQLSIFEAQCELSKSANLPLEVHSRYGEDDTIGVLSNDNYKGVIHCFSGSANFAKQVLDLGFFISFSGIVTFKNAEEIQQVARYVPDCRLLIETDAPFLAPTPFRGKINEPAFVKKTAEFLAVLRNTTPEDIYNITSRNFFTMFDKAVAL